jgi:3-phytase
VDADLEGMALAKGPGNTGYIVVSVQGKSKFALYDRQTNDFLRTFSIGANGNIDSVQQTDGIDISTSNLGPGFEHGVLVAHDGENSGSSTSNLKFVPLVVP